MKKIDREEEDKTHAHYIVSNRYDVIRQME